MRAFFPFVLAGVLYSGGVVAQSECLCGVPHSPTVALARADAVFAGQVESIQTVPTSPTDGKSRWARSKVTIRVSQSWKGDPAARLEVYTGMNTNECGYAFVRGKKYLIYADKIMQEGAPTARLSTTTCDRTREYGKAAEDLRELGAGQKPKAK